MKKKIKIVVFLYLMMTSCDPAVYLNFYIENNCEQSIIVKIKIDHRDGNGIQTKVDTINSHSKKKIDTYDSILGFEKPDIIVTLKELKITKDETNIKFNPLDIDRWLFVHSSKYQYDATLVVNPEDFE